MTFEEFIKNYVKVYPKGERIKLTSFQYAFLNWLEDCKKKGVNVLHLKGRGRI